MLLVISICLAFKLAQVLNPIWIRVLRKLQHSSESALSAHHSSCSQLPFATNTNTAMDFFCETGYILLTSY